MSQSAMQACYMRWFAWCLGGLLRHMSSIWAKVRKKESQNSERTSSYKHLQISAEASICMELLQRSFELAAGRLLRIRFQQRKQLRKALKPQEAETENGTAEVK